LQQQFPLPSTLNQSKSGLDNGERHIMIYQEANTKEQLIGKHFPKITKTKNINYIWTSKK